MICPSNRLLSTLCIDEMEHPSALDICCGRGKGRWNLPGNRQFKELVNGFLQQYGDAPSKADKSRVVQAVVETVQKKGSRFLKRDQASGKWYEIGSSETRSKVAHAIRDHLATTKRKLDKVSSKSRSSTTNKQDDSSRNDITNNVINGFEDTRSRQTTADHNQRLQHMRLLPAIVQYECPMQPVLSTPDNFDMALEPPRSSFQHMTIHNPNSGGLSESSASNFQSAMLPMQGHHAQFPDLTMSAGEALGQNQEFGTDIWPHLSNQQLQQQQQQLQLQTCFHPSQQTANAIAQMQSWQSNLLGRQDASSVGGSALNMVQGGPMALQAGQSSIPAARRVSRQIAGGLNHTAGMLPTRHPQIAPQAYTMPQGMVQDVPYNSAVSSAQVGAPQMVSRRVPLGVVKQSWGCVEHQEDDFSEASDADIEPHAVFPPE
jgi:hypothetical protein